MYDLIGDIHGHASELTRLLRHLGYKVTDTGYAHPSRKIIFLGDFIDRGAEHRQLLKIVMDMVRNGHALSVMGNHEFNALAYHTPNDYGYLRPHSEKNRKQHGAFLEAFADDPQGRAEALEFFYELPLWLDLPEFRVVHACWHQTYVNLLSKITVNARLTESLLVRASSKGTTEYKAIESLLKGHEVELPSGISFTDKDANLRTAMRVRWWRQDAQNLGDLALPFGIDIGEASSFPVPKDMPIYDRSEKPCFIGHYWLDGIPSPLSDNVACLDYSVAKKGKLVAYRWDGDARLSGENFTYSEIESGQRSEK